MRLANKTAIITGGARGIGFAIGQAMAREGANIVVLDPGGAKDGRPDDKTPAEEAAAEIRAQGGKAVAVNESVSDFAACGRAVQKAVDSGIGATGYYAAGW